MSSVNHPNIVQFIGASLNPPRVGIIMEFCANGEVFHFFMKFGKEYGKRYALTEKLRMMNEIASSLDYLHSRSIIHRDLKSENVLLDSKESCKLMDFGLSRLVDRMSQAKTTRIGTAVYMAPEIINDANYNEKCDVYSFSILMYIMITEDENPYGDVSFGVELKVSNDETFRPDLEVFEKELENSFKEDNNLISSENFSYEDFRIWMVDIVTTCWKHENNDRYTTRELVKKFVGKREEIAGAEEKFKNSFKENISSIFSDKQLPEDNHKNNNNKKEEEDILEKNKELEMKLEIVEKEKKEANRKLEETIMLVSELEKKNKKLMEEMKEMRRIKNDDSSDDF